mmetsp:Transcript_35386/g.56538  ORF Transcript_35386/g.56538 Transcript_35386/m.56538 type:complete len:535 (+) Transcript_35386:169-1773(+)
MCAENAGNARGRGRRGGTERRGRGKRTAGGRGNRRQVDTREGRESDRETRGSRRRGHGGKRGRHSRSESKGKRDHTSKKAKFVDKPSGGPMQVPGFRWSEKKQRYFPDDGTVLSDSEEEEPQVQDVAKEKTSSGKRCMLRNPHFVHNRQLGSARFDAAFVQNRLASSLVKCELPYVGSQILIEPSLSLLKCDYEDFTMLDNGTPLLAKLFQVHEGFCWKIVDLSKPESANSLTHLMELFNLNSSHSPATYCKWGPNYGRYTPLVMVDSTRRLVSMHQYDIQDPLMMTGDVLLGRLGTTSSFSFGRTHFDGQVVALGSEKKGRGKILRTTVGGGPTKIADVPQMSSDCFDQAFIDFDTTLLSGCRNGSVFSYDMRGKNQTRLFQGIQGDKARRSIFYIEGLDRRSDSLEFLVGATSASKDPSTPSLFRCDRRMCASRSSTLIPVMTYGPYKAHIRSSFSPGIDKNEEILSAVDADGTLRIWDINSGKCIKELCQERSNPQSEISSSKVALDYSSSAPYLSVLTSVANNVFWYSTK